MDFEDILSSIGEYGIYQKKLFYLVLIPYSLLTPWPFMSNIFIVTSLKHWCNVPELHNFSTNVQILLSSPEAIDLSSKKTNYCNKYNLNYTQLIQHFNSLNALHLLKTNNYSELNLKSELKSFLNLTQSNQIKTCDQGWNYEKTEFQETAVSHYDLVCEKESATNTILSISGLGSIIGTCLFGILSDMYGRKKTLFILNIIYIFGTFSPTFTTNYYAFLISRFFISCVINLLFQIPYVLTIELVGTKYRTVMGCAANIIWGIGTSLVPGFAYFLKDWIYLNHLITFSGIVFLFLFYFVPESPRWLISKKRYSEANEILKQIAIKNKTPDADNLDFIKKIQLVGQKLYDVNDNKETSEKKISFIFFSNAKIFKFFFIITLGYVTNSVAYNGLQLNSFSLSGNRFLNMFLITIIEIPSSFLVLYLMETRLGRRWTSSLSLIVCAIILFIPLIIKNKTCEIILSLVGKFLICISFTSVYQLSVELYPTPLRNQGLSLSGTISSFQSIILPYLIDRNQYSENWITLLLISCLCLTSGIFLSFLPETLNENLPQTINDTKMFGQNRKYWSLAKESPDNVSKNNWKVLKFILSFKN